MSSPDIPNAISSPDGEAGRSPSPSPESPALDLFGQEVAPASPTQRQAKAAPNRMSATYGRIGTGSSESAALQKSLESKLHRLLPTDGSMMWPLIWKRKTTPSLRQYCQLALQAVSTEEIAHGLWPTPTVTGNNNRAGMSAKSGDGLATAAKKAVLWPTPRTSDCKGGQMPKKQGSPMLNQLLALWTTPNARDWKDTQGMQRMRPDGSRSRFDTLPRQIPSNGSNALMVGSGELNPAFSSFVMGYRSEWLSLALSGIPSIPASPQSS